MEKRFFVVSKWTDLRQTLKVFARTLAMPIAIINPNPIAIAVTVTTAIALAGCGKAPKESAPQRPAAKENAKKPKKAAPAKSSLSFGENDQTKIWNRFLSGTLLLSQDKAGNILLFQKDGAVWSVNPATGATEFENPSTATDGTTSDRFTLPNRSSWDLSPDKISYLGVPDSAGNFDTAAYAIPEGDAIKGPKKVIFLDDDFLMIAGAKNIVLLEKKPQSFDRTEIPYPKTDSTFAGAIIGAGISEDKNNIWLTSAKFFFYGKLEKDAKGAIKVTYEDQRDLSLSGFSGTEQWIAGTMKADGSPQSKALLMTSLGFYWSGIKSTTNLTWEKDIRPLAEQFCVTCHGAQGAGGFSKANEEDSFKGTKRLSIIERVTQKSMPPPTSPAGQAMTEEQRRAILVWLQPELGTPSDGGPVTNEPVVIPTPGASWEATVKPILVSRCQLCHSTTYSTFSTLYANRVEVARRITTTEPADIMPKPGSAEASATTSAERAAISSFLSSFPP